MASGMNPACRCGHAKTNHFDGLAECSVCECEAFEEAATTDSPTPNTSDTGCWPKSLPVCTGCGGILGYKLDGGCTCEPAHTKTGKSVPVIPLASVEQVVSELHERAEGYFPESRICSAYRDAADLFRNLLQRACHHEWFEPGGPSIEKTDWRVCRHCGYLKPPATEEKR